MARRRARGAGARRHRDRPDRGALSRRRSDAACGRICTGARHGPRRTDRVHRALSNRLLEQRGLQRLGERFAAGPRPAARGSTDGIVRERRDPLVRDGVRPRRPDHGARDVCALGPVAGARRARASPGGASRAGAGRRSAPATAANPARFVHELRYGEMAATRRSAVRPLLRQRRRHAAVPDRARQPMRSAPPISISSRSSGRRRWPPSTGSITASIRAAISPTNAARRGASPTRGSRLHTTPSRTPMDGSPIRRSRSAKCRATSTRRGAGSPAWRGGSGCRPRRSAGRRRRARCARPSRATSMLPAEDTYALALDGAGQPCEVVASNAGHCLFAGIAEAARASSVVTRLLRNDCFCGWGVRTLSAQARRYNPMSYHNGSVWPHDNAILAAGFSRYGFAPRAGEIMTALFDASLGMDARRLPELFCGFSRALRQQPVPYPVACSPQAWSAGSVFLVAGGAGTHHRRLAPPRRALAGLAAGMARPHHDPRPARLRCPRRSPHHARSTQRRGGGDRQARGRRRGGEEVTLIRGQTSKSSTRKCHPSNRPSLHVSPRYGRLSATEALMRTIAAVAISLLVT